ncbi:MAG TPA: hypothetical protein HA258_06765 [Thermoplasmata archaeon]|nr:hypothetical protein [Thermoplasmata archaeon]
MHEKYVIIGIIVLLVSVGLSGCTSDNPLYPKSNIQVTNTLARTGDSGTDFCAFIDVSVTNTGSAGGSADVWAEIKQDANTAEKRQSIYLDSGESDLITITFCELSFWSASEFTYRAWIE